MILAQSASFAVVNNGYQTLPQCWLPPKHAPFDPDETHSIPGNLRTTLLHDEATSERALPVRKHQATQTDNELYATSASSSHNKKLHTTPHPLRNLIKSPVRKQTMPQLHRYARIKSTPRAAIGLGESNPAMPRTRAPHTPGPK